jgi:hypothetical protein
VPYLTGVPVPTGLEDLLDPALAGRLVVENPATSSPGLAFLLATIAHFGEDPDEGWQAFWAELRDNGVTVASGWEEAYYGSFSGGPRASCPSWSRTRRARWPRWSLPDPRLPGAHGRGRRRLLPADRDAGILKGTQGPSWRLPHRPSPGAQT